MTSFMATSAHLELRHQPLWPQPVRAVVGFVAMRCRNAFSLHPPGGGNAMKNPSLAGPPGRRKACCILPALGPEWRMLLMHPASCLPASLGGFLPMTGFRIRLLAVAACAALLGPGGRLSAADRS